MSEELPPPLVPGDVDLRDFPFTPLFRARLFGSSFHARSTDAQWRAGVTLWLKSWDQVPAGTLPDDEIDLCRLAELGRDVKTWRKVSTGALHGWAKCSDGRLHHHVVAEGVLEAWAKRTTAKQKGSRGATARWRKHKETIAQASRYDGCGIAQAMPGDSKGEGQGYSSAPNGAGGKPPTDPVKIMFDSAIQIFQEAGKRPDEARSITGKLRKFLGDQKAADTVKAAHGKSDPAAYLMRILTDETGKRDRLASEVAPL